MDTLEILKGARELLSDEKHWTQGDYSKIRGKGHNPTGTLLSEKADCFCSIGALAKVGRMSIYDAERSQAFKILSAVSVFELHEFNDNHTHTDVLALFDRAIARAESEAV